VLVADTGEESGLKQGDVILEVNRKAVPSTEEYHKVVSAIGKDESVLLRIYRDGRVFYMTNEGD